MSSEEWSGGGLNPLNWPHRIRQHPHEDPDNPGARDVQNPHEWDDPDPSLRERLTPDTLAQWFATAMVALVGGGITLYLLPIFAPAFHNPIFLGLCLFIAYSLVLILWGRKTGLEWFKRLDKSIVYYGNDVDVRLGYDKGTDGRSQLFTPLRNVSFAGLVTRPLLKRDLPYDASKLRSNLNGEDTGEAPVVDRLNQTTAEADTAIFGRVLVTHSSEMDYDPHGNESSRYTLRPNTIDEDVVEDMNNLIESLESSITTLRHQKGMLEERSGELRDTRDAAVVPELRKTLLLMERMHSHFDRDGRKERQNGRKDNGLEARKEKLLEDAEGDF